MIDTIQRPEPTAQDGFDDDVDEHAGKRQGLETSLDAIVAQDTADLNGGEVVTPVVDEVL